MEIKILSKKQKGGQPIRVHIDKIKKGVFKAKFFHVRLNNLTTVIVQDEVVDDSA